MVPGKISYLDYLLTLSCAWQLLSFNTTTDRFAVLSIGKRFSNQSYFLNNNRLKNVNSFHPCSILKFVVLSLCGIKL